MPQDKVQIGLEIDMRTRGQKAAEAGLKQYRDTAKSAYAGVTKAQRDAEKASASLTKRTEQGFAAYQKASGSARNYQRSLRNVSANVQSSFLSMSSSVSNGLFSITQGFGKAGKSAANFINNFSISGVTSQIKNATQAAYSFGKSVKLTSSASKSDVDSLSRQYILLQNLINRTTNAIEAQKIATRKTGGANLSDQDVLNILDTDSKFKKNKDNLAAYQEQLKRTSERLKKAGVDTNALGKNTIAFSEQLAGAIRRIGQFLLVIIGFQNLQLAVRNAMIDIRGLSQELANLRKVVRTGPLPEDLTDNVFDLANAYGRLSTEVAANIAVFAQQGNSIEKSLQLTRAALVAANAANLDLKDAVEFLTSATKVYKDENVSLVGIVDKVIAVQARHAVTAKDLANVFKATGAAANEVGVSIDELIGVTTAIATVTRKSGTAVGNSLKTIFARFGGIESQSTLANIADINLTEVRNNQLVLKSFTDVVTELAGKWGDLDQSQKVAIARSVGGIRRYTDFLVLMNNFDESVAATTDSLRAHGEAVKAADEQVKTLDASYTRIRNASSEAFSSVGQAVELEKNMSRLADLTDTLATGFKRFVTGDVSNTTEEFVRFAAGGTVLVTVLAGLVKGSLALSAALGSTLLGSVGVAAAALTALVAGVSLGFGVTAPKAILKTNEEFVSIGEEMKRLNKIADNTNSVFSSTADVLDMHRDSINSSKDSEDAFRHALELRAQALGVVADKTGDLIDEEERLNKLRGAGDKSLQAREKFLKLQAQRIRETSVLLDRRVGGINKLRRETFDTATAPSTVGTGFSRLGGENRPADIRIAIDKAKSQLASFESVLGARIAEFTQQLGEKGAEGFQNLLATVTSSVDELNKLSDETVTNPVDFFPGNMSAELENRLVEPLINASNAVVEFKQVLLETLQAVEREAGVGKQLIPVPDIGIAKRIEETFERIRQAASLTGFEIELASEKFIGLKDSFSIVDATIKALKSSIEETASSAKKFEREFVEAGNKVEKRIVKLQGNKPLTDALLTERKRAGVGGQITPGIEKRILEEVKGATGEERAAAVREFISGLKQQVEAGVDSIEIKGILAQFIGEETQRTAIAKELATLVELEKEIPGVRENSLKTIKELTQQLTSQQVIREKDIANIKQTNLLREEAAEKEKNRRSFLLEFTKNFAGSIDDIYKREVELIEANAAAEKKKISDEIRGLDLRIESLNAKNEDGKLTKTITNLEEKRRVLQEVITKEVDSETRKRIQLAQLSREMSISELQRAKAVSKIATDEEMLKTTLKDRLDLASAITSALNGDVIEQERLLEIEKKRIKANLEIEKSIIRRKREAGVQGFTDDTVPIKIAEAERRAAAALASVNFQQSNVRTSAFAANKESILGSQASGLAGVLNSLPAALRARSEEIEQLQVDMLAKNAELQRAFAEDDVKAIVAVQHELGEMSRQMDELNDKSQLFKDAFLQIFTPVQTAIQEQFANDFTRDFLGGTANVAARVRARTTGGNEENTGRAIAENLEDPLKKFSGEITGVQTANAKINAAGADATAAAAKAGAEASRNTTKATEEGNEIARSGFVSLGRLLGNLGGTIAGGGGKFASFGSTLGSAGLSTIGKQGTFRSAIGGVFGGLLGGLVGGLFDRRKKPKFPAPPPPTFQEIPKVQIANSAINPIPIRDVTEVRPEERITLTTSVNLSLLDASQLSNRNIRKLADAISKENEKTLRKIGR